MADRTRSEIAARRLVLLGVVLVAACAHAPQPAAAARDAQPQAVVTVELDGSGEFGSISAALAAAPDGAVVRVGPGTFEERVLVTKSVTIEGAGPDRTRVFSLVTPKERQDAWDAAQAEIAAASSDAERKVLQSRLMVRMTETLPATLRVRSARDVVVRGLNLSSSGEPAEGGSLPGSIVDVAAAGLRLEGCAIGGGPGSGVTIGGGADVTIDGCLVAGIGGTGITVWAQREAPSAVRIVGSDIRNCTHRGISVGEGNGDVTIERCRISGSSWHGIRSDGASPTVRGNLIFANARSGIYASGETAGRIEGNLFFENGMSDVSCWFAAKDVIEGNTFVGSQREAIAMNGAVSPVVRRNVFFGCATAVTAGGIAGDGERPSEYAGGGTFEGNYFWKNGADFRLPGGNGRSAAPAPIPPGNVAADPLFVDAARHDYVLAPESPARAAGAGVAIPLAMATRWPALPEEAATAPKAVAAPAPPPPAKTASAPAPAKPAADPLAVVAHAKADILQIGDAARREAGLVALGEALRSDDPKLACAALASLHDVRDVKYDKRRFRSDVLRHLASAEPSVSRQAAYAFLQVEREPGDLDRLLTLAEAAPVPSGDLLFVGLQLNGRRADGRLAALFVKALAVDDPENGAMDTANYLRRMWVSPEVDDAVVAAWRRHPTGRNGSGLWPYVMGQMSSPAREARVRAVFELMATGDEAARQLAGPAVTNAVDDSAKPVAAKLACDAIATAKSASFRRTYLDVLRSNGSRADVATLRALADNALVGDDLRAAAREVADRLDR